MSRRTLLLALALSAAPFAPRLAPHALKAQTVSARPDHPGVRSGEIRPGDILRIRVWREPELSGEFSIDETGHVVVPHLGRWQVAGLPVDSVRARLTDHYSTILTHAAVEVTVLRRIQVLGAVRNPGLYPVDATMTVSDALALAGGATIDGRRNIVRLVRGDTTVTAALSGNTRLGEMSLESGDQLYVPERSWWVRNGAVAASAITAALGVTITLLLR